MNHKNNSTCITEITAYAPQIYEHVQQEMYMFGRNNSSIHVRTGIQTAMAVQTQKKLSKLLFVAYFSFSSEYSSVSESSESLE